jgi:hypothetical protein
MVTGVPWNVGGGGGGVGLGLDEPEQAASVMRNKKGLLESAVRTFETDIIDDRLPVLGGCNQSRMKTVAPLSERTRWARASSSPTCQLIPVASSHAGCSV